MNRFFSILILVIFFTITVTGQKERILLDGFFNDWDDRTYEYTDPDGDGRFGYDFTSLKIENDESFIYFYFDIGLEINLQDNNDILLLIDTDNDYSTGYPIDNLGADLIYAFGDRGGSFFTETQQISIKHKDITLISMPTISSDHFEVAINRFSTVNGRSVFPDSEIRLMLLQDVQNGDKFPDQSGGLEYKFHDQQMEDLPEYSISKHSDANFRLMSYNVLQDNLFQDQANFQRIITALNPDIIAFQEIYDHSALQTRWLIESWLGGTWYSAEQGPDIITMSRYPIIESHYIAGNGAFLLDIEGEELLLVNAHLPCCDNDSGRQDEVDQIMEMIRDAKNGQHSLDLKEKTPVILTGDMNFVGKNRQVRTFIEGDIQNEFLYGDDFTPDWDGTDYKDLVSFATETPLSITWGSSYSSYNPGKLDYVIYSDAVLKLHNAFSLMSPDLPQDSLNKYSILKSDTDIASDHFPVVADFEIDYTNTVDQNAHIKPDLLEIYPVPFNDFLFIDVKQRQSKELLSIYLVDGTLIRTEDLSDVASGQLSISTSDWPNGAYLAILTMNGKVVSSKVLIK